MLDQQPITSRVDLNVVRRNLERRNAEQQSGAGEYMARQYSMIGLGGLPRLLEMLANHYEFAQPQSAELHQVEVWTLNGQMTEKSRERFLAADDERLPPHIPATVTVALGKEDLFPFRLEFRQEDSAETEATDESASSNQVFVNANDSPMLIAEFFEVEYNRRIDPQEFVFRPVNAEVRDVTSDYMAGLLPEIGNR